MNSKILNCKNDFPIFKNQSLAYLDTASTSQKPNSVINAVTNFYKNYNANVHQIFIHGPSRQLLNMSPQDLK